MSGITQQPAASTPSPVRLDRLVKHQKEINYALLGAAVALLLVPIIMTVKYTFGVAFGPVFVWASTLSLTFAAMAVTGLTWNPEGGVSPEEKLRLQLLGVGGLVGLATALLGFVLPLTEYRETLSKGVDEWRKNWGAIVWPGLALVGGLVLMFLSLQLGRGMERRNQNIRRLIYGYNAILTTLLLIGILALPNVLAYFDPFSRALGHPFDWTRDQYNALSPSLRNVLSELNDDVNVYLLMSRDDEISQNTQKLLQSSQSVTGKLRWQLITREPANKEKIGELMRKYAIREPHGMLIVVGKEGGKTDHQFIPYRDLFQEVPQDPRSPRASEKIDYVGENALYNALTALIGGNMVIYFTQGHGELTLQPDMAMPGMPRKAGGLSELRRRLTERRSVEVKPLPMDADVKSVPDDATVVVVARPTQRFSPDAAKTLREYMRPSKSRPKGGRIILLLEPIILKKEGGATVQPTGLEGLLTEFGVQLGNDRVMCSAYENPLNFMAVALPDSDNPIARAFSPEATQVVPFLFENSRTVQPDPKAKGSVDALFLAVAPSGIIWPETDMNKSPQELAAAVRRDRALQMKLRVRALPVAVVVSESSAPPGLPRDRAHAGLGKTTPRMVVFGTGSWIGDEGLRTQTSLRIDLFNSMVSWLGERTSIGITIPPRSRKEYHLNLTSVAEFNRARFLPLGLMLLGVVALGTGVWVVRRR